MGENISHNLEMVLRGRIGINYKSANELYVLLFSKRLLSKDSKQKKLKEIQEILEDEWKLK